MPLNKETKSNQAKPSHGDSHIIMNTIRLCSLPWKCCKYDEKQLTISVNNMRNNMTRWDIDVFKDYFSPNFLKNNNINKIILFTINLTSLSQFNGIFFEIFNSFKYFLSLVANFHAYCLFSIYLEEKDYLLHVILLWRRKRCWVTQRQT